MKQEGIHLVLRQIVRIWIFLYFLFFLWAILKGDSREITLGNLSIQFSLFTLYVSALILGGRLRFSSSSLFFLVLIINLLGGFLLREYYWYSSNLPFGFSLDVDSYQYQENAIRMSGRSFFEMLNYVFNYVNWGMDDIGYSTITWAVYSMFNDPITAQYFLLILSGCAVSCASVLFYKLAVLMGFSYRGSIIAALLYGAFPFVIVISSVGLKENFFCLVIIGVFYQIHKVKIGGNWTNWMCLLLLILCTYLFRSIVALILMGTCFFYLLANRKTLRRWILCAVGGGVLFVALFDLLLSDLLGGITLEMIMNTTTYRLQRVSDNVYMQWTIQALSAFLGPFPSFLKLGQFSFLHSAGTLLKVLLGFSFLFALKRFFGQLNLHMAPHVLYCLLSMVVLVGSGVALDMRYHITIFPSFLLLSLYGMSFFRGKIFNLQILYFLIISAVVIMYNNR